MRREWDDEDQLRIEEIRNDAHIPPSPLASRCGLAFWFLQCGCAAICLMMTGAAVPGKRVAKAQARKGDAAIKPTISTSRPDCFLFTTLAACNHGVFIVFTFAAGRLAICACRLGQAAQAMYYCLAHHRALLRLEPDTAHAPG